VSDSRYGNMTTTPIAEPSGPFGLGSLTGSERDSWLTGQSGRAFKCAMCQFVKRAASCRGRASG